MMENVKITAAMDRVRRFAKGHDIEPPASVLADDGGPSDALMSLCEATDLSLDWVFGLSNQTFRKS